MTEAELPGLTRDTLKECGVTLITYQLKTTTATAQAANPQLEQTPATGGIASSTPHRQGHV